MPQEYDICKHAKSVINLIITLVAQIFRTRYRFCFTFTSLQNKMILLENKTRM